MFTDKNNAYFGDTYPHCEVRVKRDHIVFLQVFPIGPQTGIPMERARRELSIDMAVVGPTLKTSENTAGSHFTFTATWG